MSGPARGAIVPLLAAAALCLAAPAGATVYSFVDENGVTHFSNVPSDPRFRKVPGTTPPPAGTRSNDRAAEKYETEIRRSADSHGVDRALVKAVIKTESNYDNRAISSAGAQGLMQLMPATSRLRSVQNPFNPSQNIDGGVRHLRYLLDTFGDTKLALAAYNAGENAVRRHNNSVPPYAETRDYVKKVLQHYGRYSGQAPGAKPGEAAADETPPIETFVGADGTRVFTNVPWKYLESPGWRRERSP